eukprot:snap_masked-scaffold_1-processed-gene-24.43-mRNA-1 protein AED:1.00 eAED:1.00 QI:0/0/0/0/1/1/3/0/61
MLNVSLSAFPFAIWSLVLCSVLFDGVAKELGSNFGSNESESFGLFQNEFQILSMSLRSKIK